MNRADSPHTAFKQLPVVDVSGLFATDMTQRKATAAVLDNATRDAGFLYLTGHGISEAAMAGLKGCARAFFAQSEAEKQRSYIGNSANHSGYVPMGEERFYNSDEIDAKEAFDVGFELQNPALARPMLGANQWPEQEGFREGVTHYYNQVLALSKVLFKGFALALGLPEHTFVQHVNQPATQLRLIHYFHNPEQTHDQPGIGAHTDYEFFTILLPTSPGLQVLNGAGEWIDAPIVPGAFVVNIGDLMEVASNGQYVATTHRVKAVSEERYAFPMFCNLDYDTEVKPLAQLTQDQPPRYPTVICGEHLFAQTIQTFQYLQARLQSGEITLPDGAMALSSFGHATSNDVSAAAQVRPCN
ncbi:MAG: 2-oxoglutarate and iron-dependent oxygenase domain-containing protein [Pseudomonadota bacterium]